MYLYTSSHVVCTYIPLAMWYVLTPLAMWYVLIYLYSHVVCTYTSMYLHL